jgi:hypothetical protein
MFVGTRKGFVCLALGVAFASAVPGWADSINATYLGTPSTTGVYPGENVTYFHPDGTGPKTDRAGVFNWQVNSIDNSSGSNPFSAGQNFGAFCIDLDSYLNYNDSYQLNYSSVIDPDDYLRLARLYAAHYNDIGTSDTNAAAFQLAVWEIIYVLGASAPYADGELWTSGHSFYVDGGKPSAGTAGAIANTWLADTDKSAIDISNWNVIELQVDHTSGGSYTYPGQNLVYGYAVPIPAAVWMGLSTMAGVGVVGWRRRKRSSGH